MGIGRSGVMMSCRPPPFWERKFEAMVTVTLRWYLPFSLSLRDVEELIAERV